MTKKLEQKLAITESCLLNTQKDKEEMYQLYLKAKEDCKTAYIKGMRHLAKALKDYDRTEGAWTDYFEHTVDKVLKRELSEVENSRKKVLDKLR